MPYIMCPLCRNTSHVTPACDHIKWYEDYHPRIPFGDLVPARCLMCWHEIHKGDIVIIRNPLGDKSGFARVGDKATVTNIWTSTDGNLYQLRMENGKEYYFIRSEIRALIGKETNDPELYDRDISCDIVATP